MDPLWSRRHKVLAEEMSLQLAAATIVITLLAFVTTVCLSLNGSIRTYPITIAQHSFSISNTTKPISELQSAVWDAELKFSQNSDLLVHIKHFEGFVYYPEFKAMWCASVKPVDVESKRPNGLLIRFDMRGCGEERLGVSTEEAMEVHLEMKMDLVVPYQFGKTRIWAWLWGFSVEESCSELRVEFVSSVGEWTKLIGEGGWCFVPLPE